MRLYKTLFLLIISSVSLFSCNPNDKKEYHIVLNEIKERVQLHPQYIDDFLSNPVDANIGSDGKTEKSKPNPVHLTWNCEDLSSGDSFTIKVSENSGMENPYIINTSNKNYDFYNCKLNTTYYWTVECGQSKSDISSFSTSDTKVRMLNIDGVTNCRDLGGYKTSDNKHIKQNVIFRTARFNKSHSSFLIKEITPTGEKTLKEQLGIKTEIDLRESDSASGGAYNGYISGITYKTYRMEWKKVKNLLLENKESVKKLFDEVLCKKESYPLAFHCSQGTDRAGCIAYTILAICGVEKPTCVADYLLSNYAPVDGNRYFADLSTNYPSTLDSGEGDTLKEKAADALVKNCDISLETINKVRNILVE